MLVGFSDVPIGLNLILPALMLTGCVDMLRWRNPLIPLTLISMVLVLTLIPGVKGRYLLFLLPAMVILALIGATAVVRLIRRGKTINGAKLRLVMLIILAVMVAINVGHTVSRGIRYRSSSVPKGARKGERQGWFVASQYIMQHSPQSEAGYTDTVVLTSEKSLVHYLTGAKSVSIGYLYPPPPTEYRRLITEIPAEWMLAEMNDKQTNKAMRVLEQSGAILTKVEDIELTDDITLWRIDWPGS
jgi:hypothetical protein